MAGDPVKDGRDAIYAFLIKDLWVTYLSALPNPMADAGFHRARHFAAFDRHTDENVPDSLFNQAALHHLELAWKDIVSATQANTDHREKLAKLAREAAKKSQGFPDGEPDEP